MMVVSLKPCKVRQLGDGACRECLHGILVLNSHPPLKCVSFVSSCVSFFFFTLSVQMDGAFTVGAVGVCHWCHWCVVTVVCKKSR